MDGGQPGALPSERVPVVVQEAQRRRRLAGALGGSRRSSARKFVTCPSVIRPRHVYVSVPVRRFSRRTDPEYRYSRHWCGRLGQRRPPTPHLRDQSAVFCRSIRAKTCSRCGACPCSCSTWSTSASASSSASSAEKVCLQRGQCTVTPVMPTSLAVPADNHAAAGNTLTCRDPHGHVDVRMHSWIR